MPGIRLHPKLPQLPPRRFRAFGATAGKKSHGGGGLDHPNRPSAMEDETHAPSAHAGASGGPEALARDGWPEVPAARDTNPEMRRSIQRTRTTVVLGRGSRKVHFDFRPMWKASVDSPKMLQRAVGRGACRLSAAIFPLFYPESAVLLKDSRSRAIAG